MSRSLNYLEMSKKIKVVVTGGAGFIGSNLVSLLVAKGFDVAVIDNLSAGRAERLPKEVTLHVADICDAEAIEPLFDGATYVFHLAAIPAVQYSIEEPVMTNEVNVKGLINVLVAAQKTGVKRLVYSASSAAYGDQEQMPLVESMMAMPKSPYALQKYIGELYCRLWSQLHGLETVSLRYFNVYGPGQSSEGDYALVIAKFLKQRALDLPMTVTGDGEQTRDFVHVRDVACANLLAMTSDKVGKGEVINIGAGQNYSVNYVASLIGGPISYIAARFEPQNSQADNSLARDLLNWSPELSIEQGIEELKMGSGS